MTWGFQLVITVPAERRLSGDARQRWSLPDPVGDVDLTVAGQTLEGASELTFRAGGFESQAEAERAGTVFRGWLRVASALEGVGIDCGTDVRKSWLGAAQQDQLAHHLSMGSAMLVDDVHGLVTYEEAGRPLRPAMRAAAALCPSAHLHDALLAVARDRVLTERQALACDLVSLVDREGSDRARLLTLVTAMEVLADRGAERTGPAGALVLRFIEEAEAARDAASTEPEQGDLASLVGGLTGLRRHSRAAASRLLAERTRPDDAEALDLVDRSSRCRNKLAHGGTPTEHPAQLWPGLLVLVRDMIRHSLE
jgi:hypothetical protein